MYTSLSITVIAVCLMLVSLAGGAVGLRYKAQHKKPRPFAADEYSIMLALLIVMGYATLTVVGACIGGIGVPLQSMSEAELTRFQKISFAGEFFYISAVGVVKISILLYYKRIFVSGNFRFWANSLLALTSMWMVSFFFGTLFQATPISWNWTSIGKSIDLRSFFIAEGASDLVIDVLILCLPMPVIRSLHMSSRRKIIVSAILGLGFFCVIASSIRLYYANVFTQKTELSSNAYIAIIAKLDLWSLIEPCASIVCACLPTFGPLFKDGRTPESIVNSVRSIFSRKSNDTLFVTESKISNDENQSNASSHSQDKNDSGNMNITVTKSNHIETQSVPPKPSETIKGSTMPGVIPIDTDTGSNVKERREAWDIV